MSESINKMPRGQWMATEGRHVYHTWLADLIDIHRRMPNDLQHTVAKRWSEYPTSNLWTLELNLISDMMHVHIDTRSDKDKLFQAKDDILRYTSVDEFVGERGVANGLASHARDGLGFASSVINGMAVETNRILGMQCTNNLSYYESLSTIMRNPTFHGVLEDLSTTGFAVLGDAMRTAARMRELNSRILRQLEINESIESVVEMRLVDNQQIFNLNPVIKRCLVEEMRTQNRMKQKDWRVHSNAMLAHVEDTSFTSGCPVRKAPVGGEKSAIALLSDYMADNIDTVIVKKLRQQQIGAQALTVA